MFQPSSENLGTPPPEPTPKPALGYRRLLEAFRAEQLRQLWAEGACYGATAALLWAMGAVWGAALGWRGAGIALLLSPLVFGVVLGCFLLWRGRDQSDVKHLARVVASRAPGVSLDLLAALELERASEGHFSAALKEAFLQVADTKAQTLEVRNLVKRAPLRRAQWTLAGCALFCAAVVGWGRAELSRGWATLLTSGNENSAGTKISVLSDLELTYRYPQYTGLPPRTVPQAGGELLAPPGTEVLIKAKAAFPLNKAELEVNHKTLPLQLGPGAELRGDVVLDQSGTYAFVFYKRGRKVARSPELPIRVQPDQPPRVVIQTPGEEVEVDPAQKVVLKYEANDDYGIRSLALVYQPPGQAEETHIPLPHDDGRKTKGIYAFDLAKLKLSAGDRVAYRIEAMDNDAVSGSKKGSSRTHILKVYSAAEHREEAARKVEAVWEQMLTQLAHRMEGPDRKEVKDPQEVASQQRADQDGWSLTLEMEGLAQQLAADRDSPQELWGALENIGRTLGKKVQGVMEGRRNFLLAHRLQSPLAVPSFRLSEAVSHEIGELEKDAVYLESLLDRQKLADLQNLSRELLKERRNLTSLLEQYKRTQSPKLRDNILGQINALKKRIDALMQRMSELAKGLRDEHVNAEALQEMLKQENLGAGLDEVEKLVRQGKADEALRKLQELGLQMERLAQSLDRADGEMEQNANPELAAKYQEFRRQLETTTAEQKKLSERTRALRDRYRQEAKRRLARKAKELKDLLLKQTEQIAQDLAGIKTAELNPASERPFEEAQSELDNLRSALKSEDFDLAGEAASRGTRAFDELAALGEEQRIRDEFYPPSPQAKSASRKLAERLETDRGRMHEVQRRLKQLFPEMGPSMSAKDQEQLQKMAGEQKQLESKARGLKQRLSEMDQLAPVFGEQAEEQMAQVGQRMGQAGEELDAKDPARAYSEEKAALDQLSQFQKQMQENESRNRGGQGLPLPMFGDAPQQGFNSGNQREKVEIPDADASSAPREFRQDLLDAMKESAPESYREQVKRYYEELVK